MIHLPKSTALAVALVPALAPAHAPSETPRFGVEPGTSLTKRFTLETESALEEMTVLVDDNPAPAGLEMSLSVKQVIEVTDTYDAVTDGRPTLVTRSFDELGSTTAVTLNNPMLGESNVDVAGSSPLEGEEVFFAWDPDGEGYTASFPEGAAGDSALLEGLTYDMDYAALLPAGEVSEGDGWSVPLDALRAILAPSGNLKIQMEDDQLQGLNLPKSSLSEMLGNIGGEIGAVFNGVREEDGARLAEIGLELDCVSTKDLTDRMSELMDTMEGPGGMEIDVSVNSYDVTYRFDGDGTLLWDLDAGRCVSLELTGEVRQEVDVDMDVFAMGREQNLQNTMILGGNQTLSLSVEG